MPIISIITAAYDPVPEYLDAAYRSVASQVLPDGWTLEWVVQEDGTEGRRAGALLPADPVIRLGGGRRAGVAVTRNLGLARSRGSLVKNLDADDVLTPGAVARDITTLAGDPDLHWVTSRALDLLPDGSTVEVEGEPVEGRVEPGTLVGQWRERNYRPPVHPATLCIRRSLVTALGGWMALPSSEDTGLLIAASVVSAGYFHRRVGLHYRTWPGQATASPHHAEPTEWRNRMALISERADQLSALW